MCFAGTSTGNSADADQMLPDVASLLNKVHLYPKLINHRPHVLHAWRYGKLTDFIQAVYFESKSDRVLIYVILLQ